MTETAIEIACHAHPEVTFHVHECRFCERAVCQDCRVSQRIGGSIPALVCHDCVKVQERQRAARKARSVLGVIALAGIVLAVMVSRYVIVLSLVVGVAWMALSYRRIRSGMGTPWDVLSIFSIFRRFL